MIRSGYSLTHALSRLSARRSYVRLDSRTFADDAGRQAADDGSSNKRLIWRWGAEKAGRMATDEVCEISTTPTRCDGFAAASTVACGSTHSAFVDNGLLYTYGSNKHHQLGREDAGSSAKGTGADPAPVALVAEDGHQPGVLQVACGSFHTAAISEGGLLWTWGWGGSFWYGAGALGHGVKEEFKTPKLVTGFVDQGEEVRQVACGGQHTIVLTNESRLYTTGKGDYGRLGRGDTRDELEFEEVEYFMQSNDSILRPDIQPIIVKVDAGNNFCAALSQNGELWVWGRNDHGQLGLGEEAMGDMYSAERYPRIVRPLPMEGHRITDFVCGESHIVCLTDTGALYEWGARMFLEPHPVTLPSRYEHGLKDIVKIAAGDKYSFALTAEGKLYSWGSKATGCLALGDGAAKMVPEPTLVPPEVFGHQKVIDIEASKFRCLAITQEDKYVA